MKRVCHYNISFSGCMAPHKDLIFVSCPSLIPGHERYLSILCNNHFQYVDGIMIVTEEEFIAEQLLRELNCGSVNTMIQ
jgi:hypothetical protein